MKTAALYIRVSTLEQKKFGLSVDDQEKALIEYCSQNGYQYKIYNDAGISAHTSYKKRPALLQMIKDCQNKKIDIILFTKLDRFFRSTKDYYAVIEQIGDVPWRAIREDYNTDTANGQFVVNIMLAVAESEAARTSERLQAICQYKLDNGSFVGSACTGYKIAQVNGKKTLVKDEKTQEMIEAFFRHYFSTYSITEAQHRCVNEGFPLSHRMARRIVTNPTYTGRIQNIEFEGYITQEQFDDIQNQRKIRTRTSSNRKNIFLFTGLLICPECGHPLQAYTSSKQEGVLMYRCIHSMSKTYKPYVRVYESEVEKSLLNALEPELDKCSVEIKQKRKTGKNEVKIERLKSKLERIKILYEDGDISREEYIKKRDDIKNAIEGMTEETKELPVLPEGWKEVYNSLSRENKKLFWRKIIDHIDAVHLGTNFSFTFRSN